jgi:hypothetical protein
MPERLANRNCLSETHREVCYSNSDKQLKDARMKSRRIFLACVGAALLGSAARPGFAQLYSESFDAPLPVGAWSINNGPTDEHADFFYDYNSIGIPPAPNSTGGSTRGLRLRANLTEGIAGGVNVSPVDKSFTGDYALRFDLWSNFNGAFNDNSLLDGLWDGGNGSTQMSNYGILSSGSGENYQTGARAGVAEALYFANTGDGQNGFDFRVHGPGDPLTDHGPGGFRATVETANATAFNNYDSVLDAGVTFADAYPEGHPDAGKTNRGVLLDPTVPLDLNNPAVTDGFLYQATFPSVSAPAAQVALYPDTQFDTTMAGAMGMAWREVEIKKVGNIVTWSVLNGGANLDQTVLLATVDLSLLKVPANSGTNIMFGHSDFASGISSDSDAAELLFTLIDNVRVEAIVAPVDNADFDNDDDVDGADFLIWQRNFGGAGGLPQGDADGNNQINAADLTIWKAQFGTTPSTVAASAIPEPASVFLLASAASLGVLFRRQKAPAGALLP